MERDNFIKDCPVVFKKYRVIKRIGKGAFGSVYLAQKISTKEQVALKVEKSTVSKSVLESEAYLLQIIKGIGIPQVISYGIAKKYKILIEPLLGQSLEDIYNNYGRHFSLAELCMIAIQVLDRIETLHSQGFIHRDIKPDNMLIGKRDPNIIYLIDYGLSKKYRSTKTKKHIRFSNTGRLTGTLRYASSNALKGSEQSRRDDLISIGYMLIFFLRRELPWQKIRDKNETNRYIKIYKMKKEIKPEILCQGLPNEIVEYMKYVQHLGFEQEPNYNYLRNLFKSILNRLNIEIEGYLFSWIKPSEVRNLKNPADPRKRKSSSRDRLLKKISKSLEKKRVPSYDSLDRHRYERLPQELNSNLNPNQNPNIKMVRNYSKETFDTNNPSDISNLKSKNNSTTMFVNFDKTIGGQLLNTFEMIDNQSENIKSFNTVNNENKILNKINLPKDNEFNNLTGKKERVSDILEKLKLNRKFFEKNKNEEKNIEDFVLNTPENKEEKKFNENNILLNNKKTEKENIDEINEIKEKKQNFMKINGEYENNLKKNILTGDKITNMINNQNNFNNKNKMIKQNNIMNKNHKKNNGNIKNINNMAINNFYNINKNLNNNFNITKTKDDFSKIINSNINKNFSNDINTNFCNYTEPSDSLLEENQNMPNMRKVQTEQINKKTKNAFKEFNEKNIDIFNNNNYNINNQGMNIQDNLNQLNKQMKKNNKNLIVKQREIQMNNNFGNNMNNVNMQFNNKQNRGRNMNINIKKDIQKIQGKINPQKNRNINNINYNNNFQNYNNSNKIPNDNIPRDNIHNDYNNFNFIPNDNFQNFQQYPNNYRGNQQFKNNNITNDIIPFPYDIKY